MVGSEWDREDNEELEKLREENEELVQKLESKDVKIQRYEKELAQGSVVERWKIGKYLHDNLAQQLTSAKISISLLKEKLSKENLAEVCEEILEILNESINEVRDLSHDIIPMDVEKEGVGEAFNHLKLQTEKQHGVNCVLETEQRILEKIKRRKVATNLYHITQEAIKNAVIHGEAKNIKIVLIEHEQQLYLHIKDDGKGFETMDEKQSGMGLTIMKHRAEEMGGQLRIKKTKENKYNTLVTCSLPLEAIRG